MREWVLYKGVFDDGVEYAYCPADNERACREAEREGLVEVWRTLARGYNAAMQARNDHLGWGEYRPFLDADGQPFQEDEDDGYRPSGDGG